MKQIKSIATGTANIIQEFTENEKTNKFIDCTIAQIDTCQSQLDGKVVLIGKIKTEYSVIIQTSNSIAMWYSGFSNLSEDIQLNAEIFAGDTIGDSSAKRIKIALLTHDKSHWPVRIQGQDNWYKHDPASVLTEEYNDNIDETIFEDDVDDSEVEIDNEELENTSESIEDMNDDELLDIEVEKEMLSDANINDITLEDEDYGIEETPEDDPSIIDEFTGNKG